MVVLVKDEPSELIKYSLKLGMNYPPPFFSPCSAGAHPAIADATAWLPIHYASDNGHFKCVEVIVNFPNQLGLSGLRPALDIARGNNDDHIVILLEAAMQRYMHCT